MTATARYNIGVDIGGTFTDCVIWDQTARLVFDKAFTTPGRLEDGVLESISNGCGQLGLTLQDVLTHTEALKVGTTSAINRLINRAGAKVALITTKGHEDAVLIGRVQQKIDGLSDAARSDLRSFSKADPLVPRTRIHGLNERVDSLGEILCSLDETEIESAVSVCLDEGVEAFAVCFLWSFLNPVHEQLARRVIERLAPSAFVVLSSEIAPVIGEYERATTTILNSYLAPGTSSDFQALESILKARGLSSSVFVMQSSGGVAPAELAVSQPVHLLGSGPVGGVAASRQLSQHVEDGNVIATDMGGTSFDVGVISGGKPVEIQFSIHERYRVLAPAVEVTSIGAGGGSIARLDQLTGVLQVGPESAGSMPGPVCYSFGGTKPTVTDANAVLGRLDPDLFFAGRRALDIKEARRAIATEIAEPLGVSPEEAAMAIIDIVDSRMADLIRNLTIERGLDPREFAIASYGGGGPLHVGSYARQIGCRTAVIPRSAPVYSAWGITNSPILRTYSTSAPQVLPVPASSIRNLFDNLSEMADSSDLGGEVVHAPSRSLLVDMRYRYQLQELAVPLSLEELDEEDLSELLMERFENLYEQRYGSGTTLRAAGIEISTFRIVLTSSFLVEPEVEPDRKARCESSDVSRGEREVWFGDAFNLVPVYDADAVSHGFRAKGPCMVAGRLLTAIVHEGQSIEVDEQGDLRLEVAP